MGVVVSPAELHVDPVLRSRRAIEAILGLRQQRRLGDGPLVGGEEEHVRAGAVHLVGLTRVNRLLLHHLNLQGIQLQIEDLAQVHDNTLVDLLPQVRAEDLDEGDLQGRDLTVHEDAGEVQLHLEADIDVGTVDRWGPPQREASIGNLVQTTSLGVRELLESHGLLEAAGLLPEETLPGGEVGALEERVLQDAFDTSQCLDHVSSVVVQVPQLSIMALVSPPEGVLAHDVVLLEVLTHAPALVEGQGVAILRGRARGEDKKGSS